VWFGTFEKVPILPNFKGIFFYVVERSVVDLHFPKEQKDGTQTLSKNLCGQFTFKLQYSL